MREVLHRRHPKQVGETLREPGTRHADPVSKVFHGPRVRRSPMHQRERARDEAIAQSRQPPLAIVGHRIDITPHRLDENQLRQFGQHRGAASVRRGSLLGRETQRRFEP